MTFFNYHAKVQHLIKTGHCIKAEFIDKYNDISPALILYFDNHIQMPIRPHKFDTYFILLKHYGIKIENS